MSNASVFLSVGSAVNSEQEAFVQAIENRLRSEGLTPFTLGRNHFSSEAPLKAITDLMDNCVGTVVIALERLYFPSGTERRGGENAISLLQTSITTPWNHIEAALSYSRGLPLLVIVTTEVRKEGLLEPGYDWFVQQVEPKASALNTNEFNGILASWKMKLGDSKRLRKRNIEFEKMTIGEIISSLRPAHLCGIIGFFSTTAITAFALGSKVLGWLS
ncbi:hypothetical protein AB6870_11470 [Rahnella inusitata]|uniref:hypothetical protein n=1 Tax=Rahnella inusitata TaxID=58169 RepID=UPI0039BDD6D5